MAEVEGSWCKIGRVWHDDASVTTKICASGIPSVSMVDLVVGARAMIIISRLGVYDGWLCCSLLHIVPS